ncbi:MAG: hypothetical protein IPG77_25025 [Betaproteobacteria bacterium]|nr:hypothetical protein [Betaproteobacteria bacterium]
MSPAPMVSPPLRLIASPDAATVVCTITVPAPVSSVAVATGEAFPVAFVSLVIVLAVMTPADADPKAGFAMLNVATAVPGLAADPDRRKTSFAVVLKVESTKSATVLRNASGCVVVPAIYCASFCGSSLTGVPTIW